MSHKKIIASLATLFTLCCLIPCSAMAQFYNYRPGQPIAQDPVRHFLEHRCVSTNTLVVSFLSDLDGDTRDDLLLATSNWDEGKSGLVWQAYIKRTDGNYNTGSIINNEDSGLAFSLTFRPSSFYVGVWDVGTTSGLISYLPTSMETGSLYAAYFTSQTCQNVVLDDEYDPIGDSDKLELLTTFASTVDISTTPVLELAKKYPMFMYSNTVNFLNPSAGRIYKTIPSGTAFTTRTLVQADFDDRPATTTLTFP